LQIKGINPRATCLPVGRALDSISAASLPAGRQAAGYRPASSPAFGGNQPRLWPYFHHKRSRFC